MHATLKAFALSLAALAAGAVVAAEPIVIARADTTLASPLLRTTSEAPAEAAYPSLAEAEMIGMGYLSFDAVLAEALATPTAAGGVPSRGAVEAVVARIMGGLMP